MREFLDVQGASGATYRFRLWPVGEAHRPLAGNYLRVTWLGEDFKLVMSGTTLDLSTIRARRGNGQLYTRLNIVRSARLTEHEDIVARYSPATAHPEI